MGKFAGGTIPKQPFIMGWCVSCNHGNRVCAYVCVHVCVCVLTAIIDVSGDVDSRVVVISQTFKRWVLLKVWSYPIFPSLCLICIQLSEKIKCRVKWALGLRCIVWSYFILFAAASLNVWNMFMFILKHRTSNTDYTSSLIYIWCNNVIAVLFTLSQLV